MSILIKIWSWVKEVVDSLFAALAKEPADTELQDVSTVEPAATEAVPDVSTVEPAATEAVPNDSTTIDAPAPDSTVVDAPAPDVSTDTTQK